MPHGSQIPATLPLGKHWNFPEPKLASQDAPAATSHGSLVTGLHSTASPSSTQAPLLGALSGASQAGAMGLRWQRAAHSLSRQSRSAAMAAFPTHSTSALIA